MSLPKSEQTLPQILTKREITKLINTPDTTTVKGIRDRAILETLYSSGLRISELINLTLLDTDINKGYLRINKSKFNKDRIVPLTKQACCWIKQYLTSSRPKLLRNKNQPYLFIGTKQGRQLKLKVIEDQIREYGQQAQINKRVTPHILRHSCASHLLENGLNIFNIQKLLGHSYATTTQRYTRVNISYIKQIHNRYHPRERIANV